MRSKESLAEQKQLMAWLYTVLYVTSQFKEGWASAPCASHSRCLLAMHLFAFAAVDTFAGNNTPPQQYAKLQVQSQPVQFHSVYIATR